jgi:hypothetical protein
MAPIGGVCSLASRMGGRSTGEDAAATPKIKGGPWGPQIIFRCGEASFDDASSHPFTHRLKNTGEQDSTL